MIYGIFDSVNTGTAEKPVYDRTFDADFLSELFAFLTGKNGVKGFEVSASGGMTVSVAAGAGIIEGRFCMDSNATELSIASGNTTRTDMVVLRCDLVSRTIELVVVQGSTTPTRTSNVYELCLATVNVTAGATSISSAGITDTRSDLDLCGLIDNTGTGGSSTTPTGPTIYVQPTEPTNAKEGDLWMY